MFVMVFVEHILWGGEIVFKGKRKLVLQVGI